MSYFTFKNHQIYFDVQGKGVPFIILNGIMMSTKSWEPFMSSFTSNNQIIRVDFIDQGKSDKAKEIYTQDTQAQLVIELLDFLGIKKIHVAGISYGGEVALHIAINYPERVDRLLLFNTTPRTNEWLKDIGRGWILTGKTRNPTAYYMQTIPVIYSPKFYQEKYDWMQKREIALQPVFSDANFLDAMERLTLSAESHNLTSRLHEIKHQTLIVTCGQDYLTPTEEQLILRKNIINSYLVALPESGHASMYEIPLIFASLLLGFINTKDTEFAI